MFYFFYKTIVFSVYKEKDDIRSAYCKFSQIGESQTTLQRPFRASQRHEITLVDQSKPTYYPNYFIKNIHEATRYEMNRNSCSCRLQLAPLKLSIKYNCTWVTIFKKLKQKLSELFLIKMSPKNVTERAIRSKFSLILSTRGNLLPSQFSLHYSNKMMHLW